MTDAEIFDALQEFCSRCEVPEPCAQSLKADLGKVLAGPARAAFLAPVQAYADRVPGWSYAGTLRQVAGLDAASGVHTYVLQALYAVLLVRPAHRLWNEKGVAEDIFWASMTDITLKLIECHKMYGIWGSFVAGWFERWFDCSRFSLGRLQFELVQAWQLPGLVGACVHGVTLGREDVVINVHIPSSGHMPHTAVLDAYRRAVRFFADRFTGRPVVFVCESWLLWPDQEAFLPEHCNVLPFMRDYTLVWRKKTDGGDLWRSFYVEYHGDPAVLTAPGSYNRAWAAHMAAGGACGAATGVLVWNAAAEGGLGAPFAREAPHYADEEPAK